MSLGFRSEMPVRRPPPVREPAPIKIGTDQKTSVKKEGKVESKTETTIVTLPGFGRMIYNLFYFTTILAGVAALWVTAVGIWYIKLNVECNQNVRPASDCS